MLRIHEAMAVIHCTYPEQVANQGRNWVQDRFYYDLVPSLRDTLEFEMAELLEREQVGTSFDTLYTLAKKMEVHQPTHAPRGQGSSDAYQDRYQRYPTPAGRLMMLVEELLLLDPEPLEQRVPKPDVMEGLSLRMTQAMNHYQREEHHCFMYGVTDHFAWDCPHWESFHMWWKEQLNSQGTGLQLKEANKPPKEVNTHIATMWGMSLMITSGLIAHWVGPETLVCLWVEDW